MTTSKKSGLFVLIFIAMAYVLSYVIWSRLVSHAFAQPNDTGFYFGNPNTSTGRMIHEGAGTLYEPLWRLELRIGTNNGPASIPNTDFN